MAHKTLRHLRRIYDPMAEQGGYQFEGLTANKHLRYRHGETRHMIIVAADIDSWRTRKNQLALFKRAAKGVLQNSPGADRKK